MKFHGSAALAATAAAVAAAVLMVPPPDAPGEAGRAGVVSAIETVVVGSGRFAYRVPGEFLKAGRPVDGPMADMRMRGRLEIMAYQVSAAEYAACVADGACEAAEARAAAPDLPVTGVSYRDAMNYAWWLSQKTGESWRLPTDEEWAFAAAERFGDDALGLDGDESANPAARWLKAYRNRADAERDTAVRPRGHFGANSNGLFDLGGSVWEWTSTCYARNRVDAAGRLAEPTVNCGVRVVGGLHRGYMSNFIRDGRSGGCAAGMAPDNLGFRLVREPAPSLAVALARRLRYTRLGGENEVR